MSALLFSMLFFQSMGTSCIEVLENPRHPESLRSLTSRVSSLIAVLRESAHGVHACVSAAEGIARKVADFDSAIYFARANPSAVRRGSNCAGTPSSPTALTNGIQASQEEIMHLLKGIVEETNTLVSWETASVFLEHAFVKEQSQKFQFNPSFLVTENIRGSRQTCSISTELSSLCE